MFSPSMSSLTSSEGMRRRRHARRLQTHWEQVMFSWRPSEGAHLFGRKPLPPGCFTHRERPPQGRPTSCVQHSSNCRRESAGRQDKESTEDEGDSRARKKPPWFPVSVTYALLGGMLRAHLASSAEQFRGREEDPLS